MQATDFLPKILTSLTAWPAALVQGATQEASKTALKTSVKAAIYLAIAAYLANELSKAQEADVAKQDAVGIKRATFAQAGMTVISGPGTFWAGTAKLMQKGAVTVKDGHKEANRQKCIAGVMLFLLAYIPTTPAFSSGGGLLDRALNRILG